MKTFVYKRAKVLRRAGSFVIDILISFCLFILLFLFVSQPLVTEFTDYNETYEKYENRLTSSGLYANYEQSGLQPINNDYENFLTYFFTNYDSIDTYNSLKESSPYYTYDELTGTYLFSGTKEEQNSFFAFAWQEANEILFKDEEVYSLYMKVESYSTLMVLPALSLSVIIIFLIPSLCSKHGQSLGMKPFHLKMVSLKSGKSPQKIQIVIRFLLIFIFEYLLLFYYLGLLFLIASGVFVIVSKKRQSLFDFITQVVLIDSMANSEIDENDKIIIGVEENEDGK